MPKKLKTESAKDQSARFKAEAEKLIDAGELNPTDAADLLDSLICRASKRLNDT